MQLHQLGESVEALRRLRTHVLQDIVDLTNLVIIAMDNVHNTVKRIGRRDYDEAADAHADRVCNGLFGRARTSAERSRDAATCLREIARVARVNLFTLRPVHRAGRVSMVIGGLVGAALGYLFSLAPIGAAAAGVAMLPMAPIVIGALAGVVIGRAVVGVAHAYAGWFHDAPIPEDSVNQRMLTQAEIDTIQDLFNRVCASRERMLGKFQDVVYDVHRVLLQHYVLQQEERAREAVRLNSGVRISEQTRLMRRPLAFAVQLKRMWDAHALAFNAIDSEERPVPALPPDPAVCSLCSTPFVDPEHEHAHLQMGRVAAVLCRNGACRAPFHYECFFGLEPRDCPACDPLAHH